VRLIFLGTPEFAVPTLEGVVAAGHEIAAVLTQPDRPKGRGHELAAPPAKEAALRLGLAVHQPERIRAPEVIGFLRELQPEAMVVVGYGKILPQPIIDIPPHGILNVHASLLPNYRGAAPIQWAIANGETRTGVTTMRIDAGLDTGDILLQAGTAIGPEETAMELSPRLARMGAELLVETLARLADGTLVGVAQDSTRASFAPVLRKEDGRIDWTRTSAEVYNRFRGFLPWPGSTTRFRGHRLQVWKARVGGEVAGLPGSLHGAKGRLFASCGGGTSLELVEVQLEGKRRMSAVDFLNGYQLGENEVLEMSQ
jgi:methionyl-tRNA formyltransferase